VVVDSKEDAVPAAKKLQEETGTDWVVVKAQIHAGGRGKGGGVKLAKNLDEVQERVNDILGMQLVTPQTGPEGKKVNKVLLAQDVYYPGENEPKEYYMSVLLDRALGKNVIIYTTEGGDGYRGSGRGYTRKNSQGMDRPCNRFIALSGKKNSLQSGTFWQSHEGDDKIRYRAV
jgi:hypothetical protein